MGNGVNSSNLSRASNELPDRAEPCPERIGLVFLHHLTDEVTANNLQSFRDWNPGMTILTMSAAEPFPGGYSIQDFPEDQEKWARHTAQEGLHTRSADLLLYAWYRNRRERCDRWVIVEWDAYCAMRVEDFFACVWEFDLVAPCVRWQNREPEYGWFGTLRTLPHDLQPYGVAVVPFCFLLLKDAVLDAVCRRVPWEQLGKCNAELRFGTLAHASGFAPVANPLAGWNITWQPLPETAPVHAGMWHPVKWRVPRIDPKNPS